MNPGFWTSIHYDKISGEFSQKKHRDFLNSAKLTLEFH
jgi:hypothetical protein